MQTLRYVRRQRPDRGAMSLQVARSARITVIPLTLKVPVECRDDALSVAPSHGHDRGIRKAEIRPFAPKRRQDVRKNLGQGTKSTSSASSNFPRGQRSSTRVVPQHCDRLKNTYSATVPDPLAGNQTAIVLAASA
jgi:hypothetical protein